MQAVCSAHRKPNLFSTQTASRTTCQTVFSRALQPFRKLSQVLKWLCSPLPPRPGSTSADCPPLYSSGEVAVFILFCTEGPEMPEVLTYSSDTWQCAKWCCFKLVAVEGLRAHYCDAAKWSSAEDKHLMSTQGHSPRLCSRSRKISILALCILI